MKIVASAATLLVAATLFAQPAAAEGDAAEVSHLVIERREVGHREIAQRPVPAGTGEHLHQLDRRLEEPAQPGRRVVDDQPGPQPWLLRGDADRAVVGVAGPHAQAADGLQRTVRQRDRIGARR